MVVHHGKFVAYYRVSTDRQGIDGYGVEAQRKAVEDRLNGGGWKLVASFTEVESGRRKRRPELEKALAFAKKHKAKLIVSRLDRLTRDTRFLLALLDSGVEPVFCDLPTIPGAMGKMVLTVMVAVAELEAGLIGERTSLALAAAKRRGVSRRGEPLRLGNPEQARKQKAEAVAFAETLRPLFVEFGQQGLSLTAIAAELNRRKVATASGGKWHAMTAGRVAQRLAGKSGASAAFFS
jgi:DNA invertase Pin-like site-specific DNA recombinase